MVSVFRMLFFIILSAALIVGGIMESRYIDKTFDYLKAELEKIEILLEVNPDQVDTQQNIDEIDKLTKIWHKRVVRLKYLVWHTGIKEVEVGLSRIATYIKENDHTEALVELMNLLDFSEHYSKDFKLLWENIF